MLSQSEKHVVYGCKCGATETIVALTDLGRGLINEQNKIPPKKTSENKTHMVTWFVLRKQDS